MDTVWLVLKYGLAFFLGGGFYASILFRFTGRDGLASNIGMLTWIPVFTAIVYFFRPFG